jgi:hypothetical protein
LASELINLPPSRSSARKLRPAKLLTASYTCEWFRIVVEMTSTLAAMFSRSLERSVSWTWVAFNVAGFQKFQGHGIRFFHAPVQKHDDGPAVTCVLCASPELPFVCSARGVPI